MGGELPPAHANAPQGGRGCAPTTHSARFGAALAPVPAMLRFATSCPCCVSQTRHPTSHAPSCLTGQDESGLPLTPDAHFVNTQNPACCAHQTHPRRWTLPAVTRLRWTTPTASSGRRRRCPLSGAWTSTPSTPSCPSTSRWVGLVCGDGGSEWVGGMTEAGCGAG